MTKDITRTKVLVVPSRLVKQSSYHDHLGLRSVWHLDLLIIADNRVDDRQGKGV